MQNTQAIPHHYFFLMISSHTIFSISHLRHSENKRRKLSNPQQLTFKLFFLSSCKREAIENCNNDSYFEINVSNLLSYQRHVHRFKLFIALRTSLLRRRKRFYWRMREKVTNSNVELWKKWFIFNLWLFLASLCEMGSLHA